MGMEIERKFLTGSIDPQWEGLHIKQGMLKLDDPHVRVRIYGDRAFLTVKGPMTGFSRPEWEYEIPLKDAKEMMTLCTNIIEKTRYKVEVGGFVWEVDEFLGANDGLIVAEVELPSEDTDFEFPSWVGKEVTHDPRYLNSCLSVTPYTEWTEPM